MAARDNTVILGDFNMREISWVPDSHGFLFPDPGHSSFRPASINLLDGYCTAGLKQANEIQNSNRRTLDLCFISEEIGSDCSVFRAPVPLVKECRHLPPLLMTLAVNLKNSFNEVIDSVMYDFGRGNYDEMNAFLASINWEETFCDTDANSAASTLSSILLYAIDQFVPRKNRRKPVKPAWSNPQLRILKSIKRSALRKHSKHRTEQTRARYVHANNEYRELNQRLHNTHLGRLQQRLRSNPRNFWYHVNEQRKESGLPSCMTNGTNEADSIPGIANFFRSQFSSVFTRETLSAEDIVTAANNVPRISSPSLRMSITSEMVTKAGKQIKSSTYCGPDGIPSLILKRCLGPLATPLTIVFNLSLSSGIFPTCWKDSFVSSVHKKGCKRTVSNYRGIAALCATSKPFEIIVLETLFSRYSHNISPEQHGFMPKRSTTTNLATFT
ncbi:uncharacterized protein LOC129728122 [Wyeomyia smithii]|uniref:uncharacterized protein LOC129728122 n=1 Tax=Wyeomyia smithii TaxID=174621 RepID=UPI002467DE51|nr:uncharacterized protein LOC129728122 [Wyeomyia smithii]